MSTTDPSPPGLPVNRIEALSDGVFAIAMTLLVLELHVPGAEPGRILCVRTVQSRMGWHP